MNQFKTFLSQDNVSWTAAIMTAILLVGAFTFIALTKRLVLKTLGKIETRAASDIAQARGFMLTRLLTGAARPNNRRLMQPNRQNPASGSRGALLRHAGRTSHGRVTQTK